MDPAADDDEDGFFFGTTGLFLVFEGVAAASVVAASAFSLNYSL